MADWRMLTCAAGLCGRASARSGCASTPPAPRPRPSPAARITAHSRSPAHTQRRNATVQTLADHSARQLLHITHSWHTYRPSPALCNGICDYKPSQQMSTLTWSPVVGCFMCQLSCPYSGANGSASSTAFGRMCGMRCRRMSSRRIGSSFAARPPWEGLTNRHQRSFSRSPAATGLCTAHAKLRSSQDGSAAGIPSWSTTGQTMQQGLGSAHEGTSAADNGGCRPVWFSVSSNHTAHATLLPANRVACLGLGQREAGPAQDVLAAHAVLLLPVRPGQHLHLLHRRVAAARAEQAAHLLHRGQIEGK